MIKFTQILKTGKSVATYFETEDAAKNVIRIKNMDVKMDNLLINPQCFQMETFWELIGILKLVIEFLATQNQHVLGRVLFSVVLHGYIINIVIATASHLSGIVKIRSQVFCCFNMHLKLERDMLAIKSEYVIRLAALLTAGYYTGYPAVNKLGQEDCC